MKKKAITIIASEETYKNLASFETIEDLNETVRTYKEKFADQLNKNQLAVLNHLHNYSAKYFGVSFLKKNSIAEKLEISRRTVIRICKYLESLGIIKQLEMKRGSDMKQTTNAIIIQPIVEETQIVTQEVIKNDEFCHTNKTTSSSLKQNINNKRNDVLVSQNKVVKSFSKANFIAHWVPERFADLTSCYYNESQTIQELWKVVKQCNRVVNYATSERAFTPQQELNIGIRAFKEFVMKVKDNKKMQNKFGYFNGIVNNLMDKLYFDQDFLESC
ncbi:helix-turn-helix domain-containing protein [Priestia megaterium]|uniref:helix-turn-helix domain-containing protein n=1 Tax=Priestia megaterium TaxID=1404 RepID=UPI003AB080CB